MKRLKSKGKASKISSKKSFNCYHYVKNASGSMKKHLIVDLIQYNPEIIYAELKNGKLKLTKEAYEYFMTCLKDLRPSIYSQFKSKKRERNLKMINIRHVKID